MELQFISVWQDKNDNGTHKSTIAFGGNRKKAYVLGNIPHGATFTFDKKDVSKIIELLKMENSPLIHDPDLPSFLGGPE